MGKIDSVPLTVFLNLSWGTLQQILAEKGGEGGKRKGGRGPETEREGGQEARMEEHTCKRRELHTKGLEQRKVTQTEAGEDAGTSQSQYKKGHMTNIYLTDSDQEVIVDFVKDHKELYNKINEHFSRTKQGRSVCGRGSTTAASCLSRCARPGLSCKRHFTETSHNQSLDKPQER